MATIKLYKWTNLQYVPGWWMSKHGYSTEFCGKYGFTDCDNGTEYAIPEGFELSESVGGELCWYDSNGNGYELEYHNGQPVLENAYNRVSFTLMEVA